MMASSKKTAESGAASPAEKTVAKTARKAPARKAAAASKASSTPTAAAKAPAAKKAKSSGTQVSLFLQYMGKEISETDMVAAVKAQWQGEEIQTLKLYVKPEEQAVYYVVNDVASASGKVDL